MQKTQAKGAQKKYKIYYNHNFSK